MKRRRARCAVRGGGSAQSRRLPSAVFGGIYLCSPPSLAGNLWYCCRVVVASTRHWPVVYTRAPELCRVACCAMSSAHRCHCVVHGAVRGGACSDAICGLGRCHVGVTEAKSDLNHQAEQQYWQRVDYVSCHVQGSDFPSDTLLNWDVQACHQLPWEVPTKVPSLHGGVLGHALLTCWFAKLSLLQLWAFQMHLQFWSVPGRAWPRQVCFVPQHIGQGLGQSPSSVVV